MLYWTIILAFLLSLNNVLRCHSVPFADAPLAGATLVQTYVTLVRPAQYSVCYKRSGQPQFSRIGSLFTVTGSAPTGYGIAITGGRMNSTVHLSLAGGSGLDTIHDQIKVVPSEGLCESDQNSTRGIAMAPVASGTFEIRIGGVTI